MKQKIFQSITGITGFLVFFLSFWILPVIFGIPSDGPLSLILYPIAIVFGVLAFATPLYPRLGMKK
jgi:hypothetical protein